MLINPVVKQALRLTTALTLLSGIGGCAMQSTAASAGADGGQAQVSVDFDQSRGPFLHPERMNDLSRFTTYAKQRDADVQFYNDVGLHGKIYRVWVDALSIYDPKTGKYDYHGIDDYLSDASRLSDSLLVVMDTRVQIRDKKESPAQIKPVIKRILYDLKKRFPHIKYIEAFNEPDYNLAKAVSPEGLYDYYRVYYQAVNEINRELKPKVPLEVGGPAFMQYHPEWMRAFLDRYKADPAPDKRLDFISWHGYGEFPGGFHRGQGPQAYHFYKDNPSEVADQRAKLETELRSRGLDVNIPSFIDELGVYPGPSFDHMNDPHADALIQAAGTTSLIYWYMDQPHTVPFNWVLRHKSEERKDQLVTRAGKDKPVPIDIFTPYGNTLLMMSKLKNERVPARSNALVEGKGVYAIATKDSTGVAVMVWNYQHTGTKAYRATIDMDALPPNLRNKRVQQRVYRIDEHTSNYWSDPAHPNLQQVSHSVVKPGERYSVKADLGPNTFELVVLEPAASAGK